MVQHLVPMAAGIQVFEIQGMGDKVIELDAVIETDFVPLLEVKLPL